MTGCLLSLPEGDLCCWTWRTSLATRSSWWPFAFSCSRIPSSPSPATTTPRGVSLTASPTTTPSRWSPTTPWTPTPGWSDASSRSTSGLDPQEEEHTTANQRPQVIQLVQTARGKQGSNSGNETRGAGQPSPGDVKAGGLGSPNLQCSHYLAEQAGRHRVDRHR